MSTSLALRRSAHAAFKSLIDYAGLFPPAVLDMSRAATEYANAREGPHAWMLGRFIVPAARLEELGDGARRFPLSVIVNAAVDARADTAAWFAAVSQILASLARARDGGARIEALEVALPAPRWQRETFDAALGQLAVLLERAGLNDVSAYAEFPRKALTGDAWTTGLPGAMSAAKRARLGVKLRCGGLDVSDFPSVDEVAAFVSAAVAENLRWKATAGLHHPVRHLDAATGARMHGFLNLLAASAFASRLSAASLSHVVAEEDPAAFVFADTTFSWRNETADIDELRAMRRSSFVGYGSCSFDEPVADLTALGILPETA